MATAEQHVRSLWRCCVACGAAMWTAVYYRLRSTKVFAGRRGPVTGAESPQLNFLACGSPLSSSRSYLRPGRSSFSSWMKFVYLGAS